MQFWIKKKQRNICLKILLVVFARYFRLPDGIGKKEGWNTINNETFQKRSTLYFHSRNKRQAPLSSALSAGGFSEQTGAVWYRPIILPSTQWLQPHLRNKKNPNLLPEKQQKKRGQRGGSESPADESNSWTPDPVLPTGSWPSPPWCWCWSSASTTSSLWGCLTPPRESAGRSACTASSSSTPSR